MFDETPIYDAMLEDRAWPERKGILPCQNWQIFEALSEALPPRLTDGTVTVRYRSVNPHADEIADVITYEPVPCDFGWRGVVL